MKNFTKIILTALIAILGANVSFAQASYCIGSATIITPITIVKTADMNFGNAAGTYTNATRVPVTVNYN